MKTRDQILDILAGAPEVRGAELLKRLQISRQALNVHLKDLIASGRVVKEGVTKGVTYRISTQKKRRPPVSRFSRKCPLKGLQEDRVFEEIALLMNLEAQMAKNVADIVQYAFTEMLNNAIDHSRSATCKIDFAVDPYKCVFRIRDFGVGLFRSIAAQLHLADERDALGELLKGKTTTIPEKHTGEGIFFTSKAADIISFRSHAIQLSYDNSRRDVFVEEKRFLNGTDVSFSISRKSKRQLSAVFAEFAPERHGYRFEKTRVLVKMFQRDYVSRSEARRMLAGLDKFKEIDLDFSGVVSLGQGFADEVFRVFGRAHPEIIIRTLHLNPTIEPVIRHVVDDNMQA